MTDALHVRSAKLRRSTARLGTVSPVHVANGNDLEQGKLQGGLEQACVGVVVIVKARTAWRRVSKQSNTFSKTNKLTGCVRRATLGHRRSTRRCARAARSMDQGEFILLGIGLGIRLGRLLFRARSSFIHAIGRNDDFGGPFRRKATLGGRGGGFRCRRMSAMTRETRQPRKARLRIATYP